MALGARKRLAEAGVWPGLKGWGPTWAWSRGRPAGAPTTPLVERPSRTSGEGAEGRLAVGQVGAALRSAQGWSRAKGLSHLRLWLTELCSRDWSGGPAGETKDE